MNDSEQLDMMTIASWLYYEKQLTHEEIAHELNLNRVTVTRLLQKSRQQGIVRFTITRSLPASYELSRKICDAYGLDHVVVFETGSDDKATMNALGKAGAEFLSSHLFEGCKLGMAWSRSISYIGNYLHIIDKPQKMQVHELAGTYLKQGVSYGITWKVSEVLEAPLVGLPVPVVVSSPEARQAILNEENIRLALEAAPDVDIALVGIGGVQQAGTAVTTGFLEDEERLCFSDCGIVGEILMRFFDKDGNLVPTVLDERVIGIQWEDLRKIPNVVAMAVGEDKIIAIRGALKSGVINSLITDFETAEKLL